MQDAELGFVSIFLSAGVGSLCFNILSIRIIYSSPVVGMVCVTGWWTGCLVILLAKTNDT